MRTAIACLVGLAVGIIVGFTQHDSVMVIASPNHGNPAYDQCLAMGNAKSLCDWGMRH
jgi:hypothetical protein